MVGDPALLAKQALQPPPSLFLRRSLPDLASVTQLFPRYHLEFSLHQLARASTKCPRDSPRLTDGKGTDRQTDSLELGLRVVVRCPDTLTDLGDGHAALETRP